MTGHDSLDRPASIAGGARVLPDWGTKPVLKLAPGDDQPSHCRISLDFAGERSGQIAMSSSRMYTCTSVCTSQSLS
jgi:hypothetical protein